MRVRIHRGAHEIGGSCVEVEQDGSRLVLDVGRPLDATRDETVPLPRINGLSSQDPDLLGALITHAHQDHWGLAGQIAPGVPIYMGEATSRILAEAAFWTSGLTVTPAGFLRHREPFPLGPFCITPFLNDHSAFDAYSLLVEAGGKRLFYTGDICGHGRKWRIFEQLLRLPPRDIDVLLMEGTNIRPDGGPSQAQPSESDIEESCAEIFRGTPGMALVLWSAQNIDRLVTLYRAAKRSSRKLVMDLYTASIASVTGNHNIPRPGPDWGDVAVYVPRWQALRVWKTRQFYRVREIKPYRLYDEDLAGSRHEFVTQCAQSEVSRLERKGWLSGARVVWSLWPGYLKEPFGERFVADLARLGVPWRIEHTSGHASIPELQRLATALQPKRVVPIHSFGGERFSEYFANVKPESDGAWWDM